MFDGLRKKFSSFVNSLSKKEESKDREVREEETKKEEEKEEETEGQRAEEEQEEAEKTQKAGEQETEGKEQAEESRREENAAKEEERNEHEEKVEKVGEEKREHGGEKHAAAGGIKVKLSVGKKIRGALLRKIRIEDKDLESMLDDFKITLVESDVSYEVAERIANEIRNKAVGKEVDIGSVNKEVNEILRGVLEDVLNKGEGVDLVKLLEKRKLSGELPVKILFLGPNGAGKTTTIGKIGNMLVKSGFSCVFSASDTFRAAAIEQTAYHGSKLGIHVIKGNYGADPASVAFDAIAYAKAHGIDAVLIDTAGRQETNRSLLEEMKKIVRVAKPDLKIFVGESIAGNALLDQVREFNNAIGLDGIILTKLDCDAKGGGTLSILSETSIPILFFTAGEDYSNIVRYDPKMIIENIIP